MLKRLGKLAVLLLVSWCVMTFTHEFGHVVGGWLGGGTLQEVDLVPWRLPYSIFEPDPRPLLTLWSGPLLGVFVPWIAALLVRRNGIWFIAYFCMLANGVYLAGAWISGDRFLDTPRLLEHGAHPATIVLYCAITIGVGYHGLRRCCLQILRGATYSRLSGSTSTIH
jgi:hypothetical protein